MKPTATWMTQQRWQEVLSRYEVLDAPEYRRNHPRPAVSVVVKLAIDGSASPVLRSGRVLNASAAGLMIRQYEDVPVGTTVVMTVTLDHETFMLTGQVVHSTQTVGGFKVGIELQFPEEKD